MAFVPIGKKARRNRSPGPFLNARNHGSRCDAIDLAAASISSALARTRMSSVKLVQRTVPEESTRNSAGRAMSWPSGPPPACTS